MNMTLGNDDIFKELRFKAQHTQNNNFKYKGL